MRAFLVGVGWLLCISWLGCAIQQTYPGAWPRVDPTRGAECPEVAGDYLSDGVMADPWRAPSSLSELVLREAGRGAVVRIAQYGADSLALTLWQENRPPARRVFSRAKGNLRCTATAVALSCGWGPPGPGGLAVGYARRTVYLVKATDGSLMVQSAERSIGLLIFLPVLATLRSWHRFSPPRYPPLPPPQGEPYRTE
jgi:hypothetical protein